MSAAKQQVILFAQLAILADKKKLSECGALWCAVVSGAEPSEAEPSGAEPSVAEVNKEHQIKKIVQNPYHAVSVLLLINYESSR